MPGRWIGGWIYIMHDHTHDHARSRTISARTPRYTASTARLGPSQPNQEYLSNGGLPLIQLRHAHHARSSRGRRGERGVARLPRRVTARMHRACLNNSCLQWLASKCSALGLLGCSGAPGCSLMQLTCSGVAAFVVVFQFLFYSYSAMSCRPQCAGVAVVRVCKCLVTRVPSELSH